MSRSHLGELRSLQKGSGALSHLLALALADASLVSRRTQTCDRRYSGVFKAVIAPSSLDLFSFKAAPLHLVGTERQWDDDAVDRCARLCVCVWVTNAQTQKNNHLL